MTFMIHNPHAGEPTEIIRILEDNPTIIELAYQDMDSEKSRLDAKEMAADPMVPAAVIKHLREL